MGSLSALDNGLLSILACPACGARLTESGDALECAGCDRAYAVEDGVARLVTDGGGAESYGFYNEEDTARYGREQLPPQFADPVEAFIDDTPEDAWIVELGSGRGAFYGRRPKFVGIDYSFYALKVFGSGLRLQASAEELPFEDGSIDALFTVATLEHVPDPARALAEIDRCLKPGGRVLLYPAWYVRPWAAKALVQRPYAELPWPDRLRKASIPVRDARPYQLMRVLPGRIAREIRLAGGRRVEFQYRKLTPNLEQFLVSDSDAFSSLDPQAAAAYFVARGYSDLRRGSPLSRLRYGYEPVLLRKR